MRWRWLAGLMALALAPAMASAQDVRRDIGFLTCSLAGSDQTQSASEAAPMRQSREMLCAFRPIHSGPEETCTGSFQSVGQDQESSDRGVMIWVVKGTFLTEGSPGLLQQIYAADPAAASGQAVSLIGETNTAIVLQPMADTQAPAGMDNKQPVASAIIVLVALRLKSTPT